MDKPATCSLDAATYDAFFRDGPNKPHEYRAIRCVDLDRLIANLENALKAVCGTDVTAEMMACYKCDGIMYAETFRVLDTEPTHGYRCASCGEKVFPQVFLDASGVWDVAKRLRNQLVVAQGKATGLEAQLTAEEQCAMESGGTLSDICDLVFNDSERAAIHGYKGVHNKIAEIKNLLRLYQIQINKYCGANDVGCDGFCADCPLGKLRSKYGEESKTESR